MMSATIYTTTGPVEVKGLSAAEDRAMRRALVDSTRLMRLLNEHTLVCAERERAYIASGEWIATEKPA